MQALNDIWVWLTTLKGEALVGVCAVFLSYMFRRIPVGRHKWIRGAACVIFCVIVNPFAQEWSPGDQPPSAVHPWFIVALRGIPIGVICWAAHAAILNKLIDPWFSRVFGTTLFGDTQHINKPKDTK